MISKAFRVVIISAVIAFANSSPAYAGKGFVFFGWGEKIVRVVDLPNTNQFRNGPNGDYIDLGFRFQQVNVFFIPLWNYDGKWCGHIGSDEYYLDFKKKHLQNLVTEASLEWPGQNPIPFWDVYGGKVVLALLFIALIIIKIKTKSSSSRNH